MKSKIIFLGTGAVVPTKSRNHSSILLNYKNENILIDCGEGTQRQLRIAKINPCKITKILISHWHGDHVLGLPGLFQTLALNDYSKTLEIYGPKGTKKYIQELFKIFVPSKKIKMQIKETNSKILETSEFEITSTNLNHNTPCLAYSFIIKDKLKIKKQELEKILKKIKPQKKELYKISKLTEKKDISLNKIKLNYKKLTYLEKGKKITFILDTKLTSNAEKIAKNSDLLIAESTFLENSENGKQLASEYKHLTAKQAAQIAKKSKSKKLILTHFSQRYEKNENLLLKEAKEIFPNTSLAEDFLKLEV